MGLRWSVGAEKVAERYWSARGRVLFFAAASQTLARGDSRASGALFYGHYVATRRIEACFLRCDGRIDRRRCCARGRCDGCVDGRGRETRAQLWRETREI